MKFTLTREQVSSAPLVGGTPQVNLLPKKVQAAREQKALLTTWGVRIGGALAVLLFASVGMFAWRGFVALQLAGAESAGQQLLNQVSEKSDIQQLLNTEGELETFARDSMATNLNWTQSIRLLLQKFPEGAALCGFDLTVGEMPAGDPEQAVGLAGTISVCGSFSSAIPFLRDAASVDGIKTVTAVDGAFDLSTFTYTHVISIEFDQSIYLSVAKEQDVNAEKTSDASIDEAAPENTETDVAIDEPNTDEAYEAGDGEDETAAEAEGAE